MSDESHLTDAMIQRDRLDRVNRSRRRLRFRLSTIFFFVTACGVLCGIFRKWGTAMVEQVVEHTLLTRRSLPTTSVADAAIVPSVLGGLLLGVLVFWLVQRLDEKKGFLALSILLILSALLCVVAMNLSGEPLTTTMVRDASLNQVLQIGLFVVGGVAPVSALIGWRCATTVGRNS